MARTLVPLTDAQLAAIAAALDDVTATELARQLRAPYFTVAAARQRIRREGWVCHLYPAVCTVCGGILLHGPQRRLIHRQCEPAANAARQRQYRRDGRAQKSTPYVRRWREEHPDELATEREREKARQRERWPERPEEERAALLGRLHGADRRDAALTTDAAEHSGEPWDAEEDAYVLDHLHEPAREVALILGRSLWAVRNRRVVLRRMVRPPD